MAERVGGLRAGATCLLILDEQRFLVGVLQMNDERMRVSFPTRDYPFEGMRVQLECHEEGGFALYETEVLETPKNPGDGLLLQAPRLLYGRRHRSAWRAEVNLPAEVKSQVHPRRKAVTLSDLSASGALLRGDLELQEAETIELRFDLEGYGSLELTGTVVYTMAEEGGAEQAAGVRWLGLDRESQQTLSSYVTKALRMQQRASVSQH